MIEKLRKKFIGICIISFSSVFMLVFGAIFLITVLQTNKMLDKYTDIISENNGKFPEFDEIRQNGEKPPLPEGFNKESPFTTRYFTVKFNKLGDPLFADTKQIAGVDENEAKEYAKEALKEDCERGWIGDYRYKVYEGDIGKTVIFVSGENAKESNRNFLLSVLSVFVACSILIIVLIVLISRRAVKPAVESYEKQKQFVTNASHELKTPLTLIRTNIDILEGDIGKSEWLSDIREETIIMSELVNKMVSLARIDEEATKLDLSEFNLSNLLIEVATAFNSAAIRSGKVLTVNIEETVIYHGDEGGIRDVISILLDNAIKYCDSGGNIKLSLTGGKHPTFEAENDFSAVESLELSRLFDRFYRADKARTSGTGFGIGLSMAKAIVEKHGGEISVHNIENKKIKFKIKL